MKNKVFLMAAALVIAMNCAALAEEIKVAVAANFLAPMEELAKVYQKKTGDSVVISAGSSGKLYSQIKNGAPFDLLLSADTERTAKLEKEGLAVAGTSFVYAVGKLVLFSPKAGYVDEQGAVLKSGTFTHIALADPKAAPYGFAAKQTLEKMGLWDAVSAKIVYGESITQALQFVDSGSAELGFLAWSTVKKGVDAGKGSYWMVPQEMYTPLDQGAVLLLPAKDKQSAKDLLAFLKSDEAITMIENFGYGTAKH